MSDNIPFEIQAEIISRFPVKSLIQFRSVSKAWKSLIDSSDFIARYRGQVQHLLVRYDSDENYVSIVDDDTFPLHRVSLTPPLLVKKLKESSIIGSSHGLLCFSGYYHDGSGLTIFGTPMAVVWNISIRTAVAVVMPNVRVGETYGTTLGFGLCRETSDPKIVKITHVNRWTGSEDIICIPWQVEVFTLSTMGWRSPYSINNLPRKSIELFGLQVDIHGLLYGLAADMITKDGGFRSFNLIISFDMITEEFSEVNLPDSLAHVSHYRLSMFKVRESLVVLEHVEDEMVYIVWMMNDGGLKSFTNLFTIYTPDATILGVLEFRKSGEPVIEVLEHSRDLLEDPSSLAVYEPYSKHIDNLQSNGIYGFSFSVCSYMESLLLLDRRDFNI